MTDDTHDQWVVRHMLLDVMKDWQIAATTWMDARVECHSWRMIQESNVLTANALGSKPYSPSLDEAEHRLRHWEELCRDSEIRIRDLLRHLC
jgi:hypothetical protein